MTNVKERPLHLAGPVVRAILDGATQARFVVKPQPPSHHFTVGHDAHIVIDRHGVEQPGNEFFGIVHLDGEWSRVCPYGPPGDMLWVREAWAYFGGDEYIYLREPGQVAFRADDEWRGLREFTHGVPGGRWRPSIHMPRWASRITLEVTGIRGERLQEITEDDAVREGVVAIPGQDFWSCFCEATHDSFDMTVEPDAAFRREHGITHVKHDPAVPTPARVVRARLWDQTNGKRPGCLWADDPYVWVVDFRRVP